MIEKTRSDFYNTIVVNGIKEKDINDSKWDLFEVKRSVSYYKITPNDIGRLDLVSLKVYGNINFWWIITRMNENILDWWNDVSIGDIITVPHKQDIMDFYAITN